MVSFGVLGHQRYRLERLISQGGMADVFEAYALGEEGFERRVALKRIRADVEADEAFIRSFIDEARIASLLHHANIVGVLDFGVMDGAPFQVLEYVDGADLESIARMAKEARTEIPAEIALHVCTEIAHALDHAHQAPDARGRKMGIVHRDVSPQNILLSWGGDVALTDFGIARARHRLERTPIGVMKGKLAFMAPEQARADDVDARADIFSLGCVLSWLFSGESPLAHEEARRRAFAGGQIEPNASIPDDVRAIVRRAIEIDRNRRYPSASAMASDLGRALAERVRRDSRTLIREWLAKIREPARPMHAASEMFNVEVILNRSSDPIRRFDSIAHEPRLSEIAQPEGEPTPTTTMESPGSGRDEDLTPGQVLHGFQIVGLLGQGGMARVYRARHLVLEREYAVKVLYGNAALNDTSRRRLCREAQALSILDHPNIVSVVDFGFTPGGLPFLATELLRGRTLRTAITEDGPFSPARTAEIAIQVACALSEGHRNGIVHRDLKPTNVVLLQNGAAENVKILDYGIARISDPAIAGGPLTTTDQVLGTPAFMAPEQVLDPTSAGPPADLYALGLLMFTMLAGQPPFTGPRYAILKSQVRDTPPPLPPSFGLEDVIGRLLKKAITDRPQSADEVIREIESLRFDAPEPPEESTRATEVDIFPSPDGTEEDLGADTPLPRGSTGASMLETLHIAAPSAPERTFAETIRARALLVGASILLAALALLLVGVAVLEPTEEVPRTRVVSAAEPVDEISPSASPLPAVSPRSSLGEAAPEPEMKQAEGTSPDRRARAHDGTAGDRNTRSTPKRRDERPEASGDRAAAPVPRAGASSEGSAPSVDRESLLKELRQFAKRLANAPSSLSPDRLNAIESRYLEIRSRESSAKEGDFGEIRQSLQSLIRDFDALERSAGEPARE